MGRLNRGVQRQQIRRLGNVPHHVRDRADPLGALPERSGSLPDPDPSCSGKFV
jgi:hypothetical protein